ncbi:response regulator transcription factor [Chloroflexota bacterium]
MEEQIKVLLIEDDSGIVESVTAVFGLRWSDTKLVSTMYGEKGIELARNESPDIIILDLGLPDTDGFQVLRQIRSFSGVPIVILTVIGEEINKIRGLELGADDYIVKPFSPGELLARVRAVLRRSHTDLTTDEVAENTYIRRKIRIDFTSREVCVGGKALKISPTQYEILQELVINEDKVVSKQQLLKKIERTEQDTDIKYLDVNVNSLKEMIEIEADHEVIFVEENGEGYKFVG